MTIHERKVKLYYLFEGILGHDLVHVSTNAPE